MPRDMWKPEAFPIKLKITPDGDKFKCVVKLGDSDKSQPVYGKTAAEALTIVAVYIMNKQIDLDMMDDLAGLLGPEEVGSRERGA